MPEPITLLGFAGGTAAVAGHLVLTGHLARRHFEIAKECVDILLGAIAMVVASPLILLCAIIIKLTSRGPVFYSQIRVGKRGHLFRLYKLRTMYIDAESTQGAVWAEKEDPRVVPWCLWMRRCHVDELPQLISVITGVMSLVGPRPERPEIMEQLLEDYPDLIRRIDKRLDVRPGITGLAQLRNGYDTSVEQFRAKLDSDLEYIIKRTWRMELRIMAATITKLIRDRKAH